jgi:uncharacterized protein YcaQ
MAIQISNAQARRFLTTYHFRPTDLPGVFERLGTVQYDPLKPVGRNPDLIFQARVPGYQVDDWEQAAYRDRLIYDAWDKQACLVPVADWARRALVREHHRPYHDREILQAEPGAVEKLLAAIDIQGPLSPQEVRTPKGVSYRDEPGSWYGLSQEKRVLRALWACGVLLTHHRVNGRHYYDRPERVIPPEHYNEPLLLDKEAFYRWIIARRFQATGLLRSTAEPAIWSACGDSKTKKRAIEQLVADGSLTPVQIEQHKASYYMPTNLLPLLEAPALDPRVIFLAPLDSILWDRKGVQQIFDFDYIWEVYKPEPQRRWGYYILPVMYGDRFVARVDSRQEGNAWVISRWWWEEQVTPDEPLLAALTTAATHFLHYLRAERIIVDESVDPVTRAALNAAVPVTVPISN